MREMLAGLEGLLILAGCVLLTLAVIWAVGRFSLLCGGG